MTSMDLKDYNPTLAADQWITENKSVPNADTFVCPQVQPMTHI
jgi:hypothetical protein